MLNSGTPAPDFSIPDQNGTTHSLSDYKGRWVVLYFYPKDNTPGCTKEACAFRKLFPDFSKVNAVIFGVSKDSVKKHAAFAAKYDLPFTLLSDEEGTVCEQYDIWKEKSMYGKTFMGIQRATYLIDPDGTIARTYPKVKPNEHPKELLQDLGQLA